MTIEEQLKLLATAIRRAKSLELDHCFDANNVKSRPTEDQMELFSDINRVQFRFGMGGNQSGKSQVLRREVAWLFENKHPYYIKPEGLAPDAPVTILLVGKTRTMIDQSLWVGIEKFLTPGSYKVTKAGSYIDVVVHNETGNRIIFISHDNPTVAVERMQGYSVDFVALDEMPSHVRVIEELQRRVQITGGRFLAAFTPKSVNLKIKRLVDSMEYPFGKKYKLRAFDNPLLDGSKRESLLKSIESFSKARQRTILEGDWSSGEQHVYHFDTEVAVDNPSTYGYNKGWRHIEASDPAVQSKFGFTLWAENPRTGVWYCVQERYIEGIYVPQQIFEKVVELTKDYNIVQRVCDPHESWYIHTARANGVTYTWPHSKNNRKDELIKGLQSALVEQIRIAPWCELLIEEFSNCQWNESGSKIMNSSSYHLLDTAQYFVDCKPKWAPDAPIDDWWVTLKQGNEQRKVKKAKELKISQQHSNTTKGVYKWGRRKLRVPSSL